MQTPGLGPSFDTHSLSAEQGAHFLSLQIGLVPEQKLSPVHSKQEPEDISQAGAVGPFLALHWSSVAHLTHLFESQIGLVASLQSLCARHSTQLPTGPQEGPEGVPLQPSVAAPAVVAP